MKQRRYFNIHSMIGRANVPDYDYPNTPEALLSDMKYARVHGSAFVVRGALDYSFVESNLYAAELGRRERLFGVGAIVPTVRYECGDDYLSSLYDMGIRMFTVCPTAMLCPIGPRDMDYAARFMIEHDMPLILSKLQTPLASIDALCQGQPDLKVIVTDTSWSDDRYLFPMLERHDNLHFEISSNQANDILELTKKYFGIDRVLFGADWPKKFMPCLKSLIEYADISEADKDAVAYKNACRLLHIEPETLPLYDDGECTWDDIAKECDEGRPISVPVIDAHTHMIPDDHKTVSLIMMLSSGPDSITKKLDRLGIDTMITAPWQGLCTDGRAGNKQALEAAEKYPGRHLAFSECNIHYDADRNGGSDATDIEHQRGLEFCAWREMHEKHPDVFVGIKPYWPYQKYDLGNPKLTEWYEYADAHHLLCLVHTGNDTVVDRTVELAAKYPNITFILAHSGIDWRVARKNVSAAKQRGNIVLELTYTSVTRGIVEYLVEQLGADRVLYGSDLPMRDPAPQLGWVAYAQLTTEQKELILGGNIKRLLDKRV